MREEREDRGTLETEDSICDVVPSDGVKAVLRNSRGIRKAAVKDCSSRKNWKSEEQKSAGRLNKKKGKKWKTDLLIY